MPRTFLERVIYIAIVLAYLMLGTLFALRTPDWQAPDEPAHYNNVAQVAAGDVLPVIEMGDWDNDYLETLKAQDFAPELLNDLATIQYEDHQPPLYYWLLAPVFVITNGSLTTLRLVSVILGGITIMLSFAIVQAIMPSRPQVALGTMALVAFLPQQLHITSSVNNDALAGVMIASILFVSISHLKQSNANRRGKMHPAPTQSAVVILGVLVGLAFITKTTTYFMAGVTVLVIFMRWLQKTPHHILDLIRDYLGFGISAGIFALLYWGRNLVVYGVPDFLGLIRHDEVVVGQLRTADRIANIGINAYWQEAIKTTFHSFWGQFGWMEARMADALPSIMIFIGLLIIVALSGLVMYAAQTNDDDAPQATVWITLGFVMLFALLQYVYYNLTFVQFQGRYIFTGLIPFAFGMALGVDVWRKLLLNKIEMLSWVTVAVFLLFAPLDFYLIWRVIPGAVGGSM